MDDKRGDQRYPVGIEVVLEWPGTGSYTGVTRNLSNSGALISVTIDPPPPLGTEMTLTVNTTQDSDGNVLRVKVERVHAGEIAVSLLGKSPTP